MLYKTLCADICVRNDVIAFAKEGRSAREESALRIGEGIDGQNFSAHLGIDGLLSGAHLGIDGFL